MHKFKVVIHRIIGSMLMLIWRFKNHMHISHLILETSTCILILILSASRRVTLHRLTYHIYYGGAGFYYGGAGFLRLIFEYNNNKKNLHLRIINMYVIY